MDKIKLKPLWEAKREEFAKKNKLGTKRCEELIPIRFFENHMFENFRPKKSIATRYAMKMVNNLFYTTVILKATNEK